MKKRLCEVHIHDDIPHGKVCHSRPRFCGDKLTPVKTGGGNPGIVPAKAGNQGRTEHWIPGQAWNDRPNAILLTFVFCLFWMSVLSAGAEESRLGQILQKKEVRVGTSGDYQPFSYLNPKTNQYEGMDITLAQKLGEALGAKVTFVRFKWPDLTSDLLADKFDIAMGGIGRNLVRGKVLAYTSSYMTFGTCPLVRKGDESRYPDLPTIDRPGVKVILNQGGLNDRYFSEILKQATILRHNKNEEIALKVKDGTADVWITDNVEALFWAQQFPELVAVSPQKTFTVGTKGYMIRQGDQVFLNWLNLWLEQMFLEGEIQKLQQQWLGTVIK